jgi:hypothetical protein
MHRLHPDIDGIAIWHLHCTCAGGVRNRVWCHAALQGAHTEPGGRAVKVQSMALLFGLLRNLRLVFELPPAPDQVLQPLRIPAAVLPLKFLPSAMRLMHRGTLIVSCRMTPDLTFVGVHIDNMRPSSSELVLPQEDLSLGLRVASAAVGVIRRIDSPLAIASALTAAAGGDLAPAGATGPPEDAGNGEAQQQPPSPDSLLPLYPPGPGSL